MKKAGIYIIKNKLNNKVYIGKSVNITQRLIAHKHNLTKIVRDKRSTNRYLYNAVQKYGWSNFECSVLEEITNVNDKLLLNRELYWIDYYNSTNSQYGYNLRRDSSTKCIVHEDTKSLISSLNKGKNNPNFNNKWTSDMKLSMSKIAKERHSSGLYYTQEWKDKISEASSRGWSDKEKVAKMAEKVRLKNSKYKFYQYDKELNLIEVHNSIHDIEIKNPSFKRQCIYSVCDGYKSSYKGYIWVKRLKI